MATAALHRAAHQVYTEAVVAPSGPSSLTSLLDPQDAVASTVTTLTQPGLLRSGPRGQPVLGLAASWKKEQGGRRWAFTLPRNGRWSDGQPITTRDVGFTLAVLQTSGFPNAALAAPWAGVSMEASSFWAGVFVLPSPAPDFSKTAELPILPSFAYQDRPARFLSQVRPTKGLPPASGPFHVLVNSATKVVLARNPEYQPRPRLSGFVLQLEPNVATVDAQLARGAVDGWLVATPQELAGLPKGVVKHRTLTYAFVELLFNEASGPLARPTVREAIAASVDRGQLIAAGLQGMAEPQYGPLPDSIRWARLASSSLGFYPSPAALLRGAGYRRSEPLGYRDSGGQPLTLKLSVPDVEPLPEVAKALADQLSAQGIPVTVQVTGANGFVSGRLAKEAFQMALVGFDNGPGADLGTFFGAGGASGPSLNFSQAPVDPILAHELDQLATATTSSSRATAYLEVAKRLHADLPSVFLYTPTVVYVHLPTVETPGLPTVGDPAQVFQDVVNWGT